MKDNPRYSGSRDQRADRNRINTGQDYYNTMNTCDHYDRNRGWSNNGLKNYRGNQWTSIQGITERIKLLVPDLIEEITKVTVVCYRRYLFQ